MPLVLPETLSPTDITYDPDSEMHHPLWVSHRYRFRNNVNTRLNTILEVLGSHQKGFATAGTRSLAAPQKRPFLRSILRTNQA